MKELTSSSVLCLPVLLIVMMKAMSALSQSHYNCLVLDTDRHPLQRDAEYYIKPIPDSGGCFSLISHSSPCPLYVSQLNNDVGEGLPVFFTLYAGEDNIVMENRDFKVTFSATSTCVQSTKWKVGERDIKSGRRFIVTGGTNGDGDYSNYFRIVGTQSKGIYNIRWCPIEVCPTCRFDCGTIGGLRENGTTLEALDGNALPVVFVRRA